MRDFVVHFVVWGELGAILVHKTRVDRISSKSHVIIAAPAYVQTGVKRMNGMAEVQSESSLKPKAKERETRASRTLAIALLVEMSSREIVSVAVGRIPSTCDLQIDHIQVGQVSVAEIR